MKIMVQRSQLPRAYLYHNGDNSFLSRSVCIVIFLPFVSLRRIRINCHNRIKAEQHLVNKFNRPTLTLKEIGSYSLKKYIKMEIKFVPEL